MKRVLVLLAAVLVLAGCARAANVKGPKGVPLVASGQLTVCTHLSFAPFQSVKHGEIVGFDVDLIDLVARDLGLPQKIIDTSFEGIQSGTAYNSNQCDIGTGGMTITKVRAQNMDFSIPYFDAKQALLCRASEPANSMDALRGKQIGVLVGTTGEEYTRKWNAAHGNPLQVVQFDEMTVEFTGVKTGKVACAMQDNGPLLDFAKQNPGLVATAQFDTGEKLGFGVRKGNTAMRTEIDRVLRKAYADGTYARLYKKWFT
ncbi:ABC transporter substrate-binding protein [Sciscionella sediminilitoris]|uniref:ABC transporter substrate-binding protein n=1 Tax=Sciscionella sediminilitoris TaxID=1445613 RepID=UPI0004DF1B04|nr:ABC transporter substrate-binding protein [Sciscionella sp. SE31]